LVVFQKRAICRPLGIGKTSAKKGRDWVTIYSQACLRDGTRIAFIASNLQANREKSGRRAAGANAKMSNSEPNPDQDARNSAAASRENPAVVLEARGLKKTYGSGARALPVLVDANVSLRRGEMVAIIAPSGAGKSTLLHLLAALDTPTSGTVYFATKAIETNQDSTVAEFRNRAVGFLWQRHQLLPDFTAAENVAMPLLLRGEGFEPSLATARKWLAEVGLADRTEHRAGELSGGEQQRVAIARALVTRPAVLLADEPTGDLDEQNAWAVFELLERLHRAHQLTSLIATHNLALAARCDRILGLEHGILRNRTVAAAAMGTPGGEAS
jgi:lipoprotein-releasing system ATP-binding protein